MSFHEELAEGDIHISHNWSYADAVARLAATGFVTADVGKFALQEDENSIWMLVENVPGMYTWVLIGGPITDPPFADVYLSLTIPLINGGGPPIVHDAEITDTGANHNILTGQYIASIQGWYSIDWSYSIGVANVNPNVDVDVLAEILVNGVDIESKLNQHIIVPPGWLWAFSQRIGRKFQLLPGDVITWQLTVTLPGDPGAAITLVGGGVLPGEFTHAQIIRMG